MLPGQTLTVRLQVGDALTIILGASATALLTQIDGSGRPATPVAITLNPTVVGPFNVPKTYLLQPVNGEVTYTLGAPDPSLMTPRIVAQSAVAVSGPADTAENVLATITVPGGAMGPNGAIRITSIWGFTNNVNAKTPRLRIGGPAGTILWAPAAASIAVLTAHRYIFNRGAQNSQVAAPTDVNGYGTSTGALVTSAVDTAQDFTLVLSGQKATGGDTLRLDAYSVEVLPDFN